MVSAFRAILDLNLQAESVWKGQNNVTAILNRLNGMLFNKVVYVQSLTLYNCLT